MLGHDQPIDRIRPLRPPVLPSKSQSWVLQLKSFLTASVAGSRTAQAPGSRPQVLGVANRWRRWSREALTPRQRCSRYILRHQPIRRLWIAISIKKIKLNKCWKRCIFLMLQIALEQKVAYSLRAKKKIRYKRVGICRFWNLSLKQKTKCFPFIYSFLFLFIDFFFIIVLPVRFTFGSFKKKKKKKKKTKRQQKREKERTSYWWVFLIVSNDLICQRLFNWEVEWRTLLSRRSNYLSMATKTWRNVGVCFLFFIT